MVPTKSYNSAEGGQASLLSHRALFQTKIISHRRLLGLFIFLSYLCHNFVMRDKEHPVGLTASL